MFDFSYQDRIEISLQKHGKYLVVGISGPEKDLKNQMLSLWNNGVFINENSRFLKGSDNFYYFFTTEEKLIDALANPYYLFFSEEFDESKARVKALEKTKKRLSKAAWENILVRLSKTAHVYRNNL